MTKREGDQIGPSGESHERDGSYAVSSAGACSLQPSCVLGLGLTRAARDDVLGLS